jgi:hypothetical protein
VWALPSAALGKALVSGSDMDQVEFGKKKKETVGTTTRKGM